MIMTVNFVIQDGRFLHYMGWTKEIMLFTLVHFLNPSCLLYESLIQSSLIRYYSDIAKHLFIMFLLSPVSINIFWPHSCKTVIFRSIYIKYVQSIKKSYNR